MSEFLALSLPRCHQTQNVEPRTYNFSTFTSVQHPERLLFDLSTLRSLAVSRRCRRQAAKCLRPVSIPVLLGEAGAHTACAAAGIPVLLAGAGAYTATPGSSPLSMRLGIWSGWVVKHKRVRTARKSAACPNPQERKTRKESVDEHDPEKFTVPQAGRSPTLRDLTPLLPPSHSPNYPCSHQATPTQAEAATWAATRAPSQAGTYLRF